MDYVPLDLVYVGAGVEDLDVVSPVKGDCVGSAGSCSTHDGVLRSVDAQARLVVAKRSRSRGIFPWMVLPPALLVSSIPATSPPPQKLAKPQIVIPAKPMFPETTFPITEFQRVLCHATTDLLERDFWSAWPFMVQFRLPVIRTRPGSRMPDGVVT